MALRIENNISEKVFYFSFGIQDNGYFLQINLKNKENKITTTTKRTNQLQ